MKRITTLIAVIIATLSVYAQSPEKLSYQALLRGTDHKLISNQQVGMQITILEGSETGTPVYVETQTPTTNVNGLITLEVGTGTTSDDFSAIDWANGDYFIMTETDPAGGTNYTIVGTSQLSSVPYSLHAKTAESANETDPAFTAWDKSTGVVVTESQISDLQTYLTAEVDPLFAAWDRTTGIVITENQVSDLQSYLTAELDPIFGAWDKTTGVLITESQISDLQNYLTAEVDPIFGVWDRTTGILINESQISDLQSYLIAEVDPLFAAWDRTTGIVITESQISDLQTYITIELDPVFSASEAFNVTAGDITNLSNLSGINTGDQDLSALATRANVLELDNTTPFTPDLDYEPATKLYVDDEITSATSGHYVGELFGGGIVFWVTPDRQHGLIASLEDQDFGGDVSWGLMGTEVGTLDLTDGAGNTALILAESPAPNTAAVVCDLYTGGGRTDWYLPSNREMDILGSQILTINYVLENDGDSGTYGFYETDPPNANYWTSTEYFNNDAWLYRFNQGRCQIDPKTETRRVRAIRAF